MNTEEDFHLLNLVMTEDYSTLSKEQLLELVHYLQGRVMDYHEKEIDAFFGGE